MNTKLLYELADRIESYDEYAWSNQCNCNCGLLACLVMKVTPNKLRLIIREDHALYPYTQWGKWEDGVRMVKEFGTKISRPIKAIVKAGFTLEEIAALEQINNSKSSIYSATPGAEYRKAVANEIKEMAAAGLNTNQLRTNQ